MYKTGEEAKEFIYTLTPHLKQCRPEVYLAPSFTAIYPAYLAARDTKIVIGAQNMHEASEGAFTGEVSAAMLKEVHAAFVILGHSERRNLFCESDALIQRKVRRALAEKIRPILCIGEKQEERDLRQTQSVLSRQLDGALMEVSAEELSEIVIAYEPVWAIGTGKTATPELAEEAHAFIRSYLDKRWSFKAADGVRILYGGSVKVDNIAALMAMPNIDGALVGGASLKVESFAKLIDHCNG